jgi:hypothetical protein
MRQFKPCLQRFKVKDAYLHICKLIEEGPDDEEGLDDEYEAWQIFRRNLS